MFAESKDCSSLSDILPEFDIASMDPEKRSDVYLTVGDPAVGLKFRDFQSWTELLEQGGLLELKLRVGMDDDGWEKWDEMVSKVTQLKNQDEELHHCVKRSIDQCQQFKEECAELYDLTSAILGRKEIPKMVRIDKVRFKSGYLEQTDVEVYELLGGIHKFYNPRPNFIGSFRTFAVDGRSDKIEAQVSRILENLPNSAKLVGYPGFIEMALHNGFESI